LTNQLESEVTSKYHMKTLNNVVMEDRGTWHGRTHVTDILRDIQIYDKGGIYARSTKRLNLLEELMFLTTWV